MNRNNTSDPAYLREMAAALAAVSDPSKMERLLDELFTPAEQKTLELRWGLLKLLSLGVPQREIASRLGISLCKITRGSKLLKNEDSVLSELIKQ